jgi:hypothetical protein
MISALDQVTSVILQMENSKLASQFDYVRLVTVHYVLVIARKRFCPSGETPAFRAEIMRRFSSTWFLVLELIC